MININKYNILNEATTTNNQSSPANQNPSTPFIIALIVAAVVIILIAVVLTIVLKKRNKSSKKKEIIVDDNFITNIISLFGEASNIKEIVVDNGRLNITVNDLELVNLNGIKEIATNGVFVTGSTVKTLFRLNSNLIKEAIENRIQ